MTISDDRMRTLWALVNEERNNHVDAQEIRAGKTGGYDDVVFEFARRAVSESTQPSASPSPTVGGLQLFRDILGAARGDVRLLKKVFDRHYTMAEVEEGLGDIDARLLNALSQLAALPASGGTKELDVTLPRGCERCGAPESEHGPANDKTSVCKEFIPPAAKEETDPLDSPVTYRGLIEAFASYDPPPPGGGSYVPRHFTSESFRGHLTRYARSAP